MVGFIDVVLALCLLKRTHAQPLANFPVYGTLEINFYTDISHLKADSFSMGMYGFFLCVLGNGLQIAVWKSL